MTMQQSSMRHARHKIYAGSGTKKARRSRRRRTLFNAKRNLAVHGANLYVLCSNNSMFRMTPSTVAGSAAKSRFGAAHHDNWARPTFVHSIAYVEVRLGSPCTMRHGLPPTVDETAAFAELVKQFAGEAPSKHVALDPAVQKQRNASAVWMREAYAVVRHLPHLHRNTISRPCFCS